MAEAQTAIDRVANLPADEGWAVRDIWLLRLRALLPAPAATKAPTASWRIDIARWQIAWLRRTHRDGRGDGVTAAALICAAYGVELRENNKFCHQCGARITLSPEPADYKQVTVLFADVRAVDGHRGRRRYRAAA